MRKQVSAAVIFISAFLLFQIEPMIGKMILPWFGGSAGVWTTCLLFFQLLLLCGYLYAHAIALYLSPKQQALVHVALLIVSLAVLPVGLRSDWKPDGNDEPVVLIFKLLFRSIGLPFLTLSATSPLVQAWIARGDANAVPYRLFSVSNLASLIALLAYPLLIEPRLAIRTQALAWSMIYVSFALIAAALTFESCVRKTDDAVPSEVNCELPNEQKTDQPLLWVALAACPSIMLLAVTSYLTQNVAPIPLLWVVPLGLYLLSFILCFDGRFWYRAAWYMPAMIVLFTAMAYWLTEDMTDTSVVWAVALYCAGLFAACMVCHGELVRLKPATKDLTRFYLTFAVGGALGGLATAVGAPYLFNSEYELPVGLVLTSFFVAFVLFRDPDCPLHRAYAHSAWIGIGIYLLSLVTWLTYSENRQVQDSLLMARNFYGALRVTEEGGGEERVRALHNGTILHGEQFLSPARRRWPTTYYGLSTGVAMAINANRGIGLQRVGVIGLGVGTIAAYARPQDYYRFYEINPLVLKIARSEFTFLSDCPAHLDIVTGDARLSLAREPSEKFDVLVVDAFSGDSVPVHLLTQEAMTLYLQHLQTGGILAVHVSNLYLNLAPIVRLNAESLGRVAQLVDSDDDDATDTDAAAWVLVSETRATFANKQLKLHSAEIPIPPNVQPWTDDYSSILPILN
jgi:hypothetical protein